MADPTTTNWALPYPVGSDQVNGGAAAIQALAQRLDAILAAAVPVGVVMSYVSSATPPPDGDGVSRWKICDGTAVSRTTYATLFSVIGSTYGTGDGSTTFNLPDIRGRTVIGSGAGSGLTSRAPGSTGGVENQGLAVSDMPYHGHSVYDPGHAHSVYDPGHAHGSGAGGYQFFMGTSGANLTKGANSGGYNVVTSNGAFVLAGATAGAGTGIGIYGAGTGIGIQGTGGGTSPNVMQPFVAVNHIIKVL